MRKIKSFKLYEASSPEQEAKELNDIVELALFGLIEDYDPTIDSWLKDNRFFVVQLMFSNRNQVARGLSVDYVKGYIENVEYLLGAYKHIYTAMRKIVSAGYECKLNHANEDNGQIGPYFISLIIPRKGTNDTSTLGWLTYTNSEVVLNKSKLETWLHGYSQTIDGYVEDTEMNDENVVEVEFSMEGLGMGGEPLSPRQIIMMEDELKTCNRIIEYFVSGNRVSLHIKLEEGESLDIN